MTHFIRCTLGLAVVLFLSFNASAQGRAMEVIFKPDMDKEALESIQKEAKANGLELTYTRMDYKEGLLTSLAFVLKTRAGMGSAETESLSEEKPFGFRYDHRAGDGEAVFSVGTLEPIGTKAPASDN